MITKLGREKLQKEIKELKLELKRTYEERSEAAAEGDLKENSAYIFMGERAQVLSSQISEAEDDLKLSIVKEAPKQIEIIEFGHRVKVIFEQDKREINITLVGKNDARLKTDWISFESPIGLALMGKKKSDRVLVNDQFVTVLDIEVGEI
ncbi:MAG: GreA/GreB family elongation factor [Candidatus Shapirobacteria bacterium]